METAEIKLLKRKGLTGTKYQFFVESVGPFGIRKIAETKLFTGDSKVLDDDSIHERTGFMNEGRKLTQQKVRDKHVNTLLQDLAKDGWQILPQVGEHWYSIRLQRNTGPQQ